MSTRAQLEAEGYALPMIHGDLYASATSTILSGVVNFAQSVSPLAVGTALEIINDNTAGSGDDLIVRLNAAGNPAFYVRAGETKTITGYPMTVVYLTNSSGSTITYRLFGIGVSNT